MKAEAWTKGLTPRMFSKIEETGNVLSTIESQGLRKEMTSVTEFLKLSHLLREMTTGPE